jgi:lipopolysaccharide transport system ATP-binding protein
VKKGEAVGIIGENGSGKSTLLKIIANILRPSSGSVKINGRITPFLELGVGFQPDLTSKENIYVYGAIMGMSDKEIDAKLEEILEFSGLSQFQDAKLKNLSSGMQVRLAFATAVQTDPEILLMDEVLAVGDMEFQQKCFDVFQRYIKEKKTIVFVSHDLNSIRRFCSKSLLLRRGEQVTFGDTNTIIDKYVYGVGDTKISNAEGSKKSRWGNQKVEIVEVRFIDKFDEKNTFFYSGDPMTIQIRYAIHEAIADLVFGIAIYSENGTLIYGSNTDIAGYIPEMTMGNNEIRLIIDKLVMIEGKFSLTIAAHNKENVPYDWLDKQFSFNVLKKGNNVGLIDIPCGWKQYSEP